MAPAIVVIMPAFIQAGSNLCKGVKMSEIHIKPGIYRHYKGKDYQVYGIARHSETEEPLVVYRTLYGNFDLWVRPYEMFTENISVGGEQKPRFQWLKEAEKDAL